MSSAAPLVCLITPGHLASTPRLVKNADALVAAGYRVHVVASRHFAPAEPLDASIVSRATWTCERVTTHSGLAGLLRRLQRQLARQWLAIHPSARRLAAQAHFAGHAPLLAAAGRSRANFFYGHGGVAGLAIAAAAADRTGVRYGFDAEDWHEGESADTDRSAPAFAIPDLLRTFLPRAQLVTCAAPLIGEAYARAYAISPVNVLNVFPLTEAPDAPISVEAPTPGRPAVFYWFSQTVGPHRGLEELFHVLALMRAPCDLHLRGFVEPGYCAMLRARAAQTGFKGRIAFLPPAAPTGMIRLAAGAHLGLSLEKSIPRNRDLCLTNKIFTYLLAGVPVLLTPTSAQRQLAPQLGAAARLLDRDPVTAARDLDDWLADPMRLSAARRTAWALGRDTFNWEREQQKLLGAFAGLRLASS